MNYKDTLNLPSTKFPMKGNLPQKEPEILQFWKDINLYQEIRNHRKKSKKFLLHDGPPYANGDIHIGHAVNKILKDIVIKSKTLSGYDSPYIPGWDCHGLPIELNVEKKFGKSKFKDNKNAFRKTCREYAQKQVEKQKIDFIRLGVVGDWENSYTSMDKNFESSIVKSLSEIIKNKHIYYGSKPVHWCIESESALAEAEVEYKDITSNAVYVMFEISDEDSIKRIFNIDSIENCNAVIWTTTPWTLPSNQALAIGTDIMYSMVVLENNSLIIATDLIEKVTTKIGVTDYKVIGKTLGKDLVGLIAMHPFYEREIPIIEANHVTTEDGTGLVHIAPGHGQEDYIAGIENNLEIFNPVNDKGRYIDTLELFGGLSVREVDPQIIDVLTKNNKLLFQEKYNHSYPHCWRYKTPLIFRSTPQWFISMDNNNLRSKIIKSLSNTEWLPSWGLERIENMIKNRPDWCISRQRFWGVPMPLFIHKETKKLHDRTDDILQKAAEIIHLSGIEGWFDYDKQKLLGSDASEYELTSDILDVWFDSGVTHICVMRERNLGDVADLYLEGSDQHRGWFQSSLITALATTGKPPYKSVLTHGFVVDADGQKMSKSLGNIISPQDIIKKKGSDILRLWVASTDYTKEMNISDDILNQVSESYRRIRNTAKFLLSNISDFNAVKDKTNLSDLLLLDKWMIHKSINLQNNIIENYNKYKFHQIAQDIQNFCTIELGGFYLDIIKDRLYTTKKTGITRRSCQKTCHIILEMLSTWIAPLISFTAEEIYQSMELKDNKSIFIKKWANYEMTISQEEINICEKLFQMRQTISKELENLRNNGEIGSSLDADLKLHVNKKYFDLLNNYSEELKFIFITSNCYLEELTSDSDAHTIDDLKFKVIVEKSNHPKCERCWHKNKTVNFNKDYKDLCKRCYENIYGDGEQRQLG